MKNELIESINEINDTLQLIENDRENFDVGIQLITEEMPIIEDEDEEIDITSINLKKIKDIPNDLRILLEQLEEQVDILEEQTTRLKKLKILKNLE